MSLAARVDRARWWLIQHQPFYGALAMRLVDKIGHPGVPTAATDGIHIFWSEDWAGSLTDEELRFVLAHETLHCAHGHLWRMPLTMEANIAQDHAINLILRSIPGMTMPQGALADPQYQGLAEEEILARLPRQQGGYTDAAGGTMVPVTGKDKPIDQQWQEAVLQAAMAASAARSDTPGDMQRLVDAARRVRPIDWRAALMDFVRRSVAVRNDWSRLSRRSAGRRYIVPRKRADQIGTIVFARDTSGSIGDDMLAEFNHLIASAMLATGCRAVVMDCDAAVRATYELAPGQSAPSTAKGGGGTDFRPVFDAAGALSEPIAGVVYLTDLCGTFPTQLPEYPVLWIASRDGKAPFGRVVLYQ